MSAQRNQPWVLSVHGPWPTTETRVKTPAPIEGAEPSLVYYQDRIVMWHRFPNRAQRRRRRYEAKLARRQRRR